MGISLAAGVLSHTFRDTLAPALRAARLCSTGTNSCPRNSTDRAGHVRNFSCRALPWPSTVAFYGPL